MALLISDREMVQANLNSSGRLTSTRKDIRTCSHDRQHFNNLMSFLVKPEPVLQRWALPQLHPPSLHSPPGKNESFRQ
jgi:hypothetical protein